MVYSVKNRDDKDELTPDFLSQEEGLNGNTAFVDDTNIFNSGMNITKSMVGSSQSNEVAEYANRLIAAKAGINGAWYNWFGRWGGFRSMPNFQRITEVYPRLLLVRCVPNWDNLNRIGTSSRMMDTSINGTTTYNAYKNGKLWSHMDNQVYYSRHPKTKKLYAVFNTGTTPPAGSVTINSNERLVSAYSTNGYFEPVHDITSQFVVDGVNIKPTAAIVGTTTGFGVIQDLG